MNRPIERMPKMEVVALVAKLTAALDDNSAGVGWQLAHRFSTLADVAHVVIDGGSSTEEKLAALDYIARETTRTSEMCAELFRLLAEPMAALAMKD